MFEADEPTSEVHWRMRSKGLWRAANRRPDASSEGLKELVQHTSAPVVLLHPCQIASSDARHCETGSRLIRASLAEGLPALKLEEQGAGFRAQGAGFRPDAVSRTYAKHDDLGPILDRRAVSFCSDCKVKQGSGAKGSAQR